MEELNNVVFQNKEGISFFNYRMKMLDFRDKANEIQQNIDELFGIINELFQDTGKTISISKGNNSTLIFHQNENTLHLEQLSSGEKQLLLILLKVFLQEKKPAIILWMNRKSHCISDGKEKLSTEYDRLTLLVKSLLLPIHQVCLEPAGEIKLFIWKI